MSFYMCRDLPQVCLADAVAVLDGWEKSDGARMEVLLAAFLGKLVLDVDDLEPLILGFWRSQLDSLWDHKVGKAWDEFIAPLPETTHQPCAGATAGLSGSADTCVLATAKERKGRPLATGCLDYFPDAMLAVAELSRVGNEQHNPGTPLHWDRSKSGDEADALLRHLIDRGRLDTDGQRHSAKVAWRALALLQKELEKT